MGSASEMSVGMVLVFFVNGLAFFVMALAIRLETHSSSQLKLAESLWLLATFAMLRSVANWVEMFLQIQGQAAPDGSWPPLQVVETLLLAMSTMFLLQFGASLVTSAHERHRWVGWVPAALVSLWVLVVAASQYWRGEVGSEWLLAADVWARTLLYLPGAALSGLGVFLHCRFLRDFKLPHLSRTCNALVVALGAKALLAGLVVRPAPFFPASVLNDASFLAGVGVPVQVLRTITALCITALIVHILRVFDFEENCRLESATWQRFQAQEEALEAQRQACQGIQRWNERLQDVVNTIATAISQPIAIEEMLDIALRKALDLTGIEAGGVFLVDEQAESLTLVAHHGLSQQVIQDLQTLRFDEGMAGRAARSRELVVVEDLSEDPRLTSPAAKAEGFRFHVSLPLMSRDVLLGIMSLTSRGASPFTPQETFLLTAIGQQVGVAIENMRLYEQVQSLAALKERDRLGRELHDGLAQVLGYLHLKGKSVQRLLASGRVAEAESQLSDMQGVAREAYADVRESILGLRTTVVPGAGLIPTLTEYLRRFSRQSGISTRLSAGHDSEIEFSPVEEIQLLRIVQEALTNTRKHSQASSAWVRFESQGEGALITVEDDGLGFDPGLPGQDGAEHFGLQTMRERAESVGADLSIWTQPGEGTRVLIRLPLGCEGGE